MLGSMYMLYTYVPVQSNMCVMCALCTGDRLFNESISSRLFVASSTWETERGGEGGWVHSLVRWKWVKGSFSFLSFSVGDPLGLTSRQNICMSKGGETHKHMRRNMSGGGEREEGISGRIAIFSSIWRNIFSGLPGLQSQKKAREYMKRHKNKPEAPISALS